MLTLERKAESGAESTLALAESGYIDLPRPTSFQQKFFEGGFMNTEIVILSERSSTERVYS
jgi:hypothetical protein